MNHFNSLCRLIQYCFLYDDFFYFYLSVMPDPLYPYLKQFGFLFLGFCTVFEHVNETGSLDHEGLLIVNNLFA